MYRTILEEIAESKLPEIGWKYVDPKDVTVKTLAPKWAWMLRACKEIPVGKCIQFPVPQEMTCERFAYLLRCSINVSTMVLSQRFSIRRSKDEKSVIVLRGEDWATYYKKLEAAS